jgi:hypothetical protein
MAFPRVRTTGIATVGPILVVLLTATLYLHSSETRRDGN